MTRRVVGVLGGLGPEATILLQQRLLGAVKAADDCDHLPLLIDMNPQVPSRIAHLIDGTGPDPGPTLAEMARRLQTAGATALAMPCNTAAHHYAPQIGAAVPIRLLNMVALSVDKAAQSLGAGASVGILASPAVRLCGVFTPWLEQAGLSSLWPTDTNRMLDAIGMIKAGHPVASSRQTLSDAAGELADMGAAHLLIACSELSLIADALPATLPVIDTLDVLVGAIHDHTLRI